MNSKRNKFLNNYKSLKTSQKRGKGTPLYTRYVNRNIGRIFAAFFAQWNISPNVITYISGLLTMSGFLGFILIPNITVPISILLVLVLIIGYGLDSADGLVSRLLNKQSALGEWLDHVFDAIKIPLGHGVAILFILNSNVVKVYEEVLLVIILAMSSAYFLANILKAKVREVKILKDANVLGADHKTIKTNAETDNSFFRSFLTLPLDYGVFMALFLLTPFKEVFHIVYLSYGSLFIIFILIGLFKSARELSK